MEPAGLSLGVLALFTFVDNGLSALSRARNLKKHASKLRAKLLIEEARLHQWGRVWGYPEEDMEANLDRFSSKLREVVLVTLHENANTLRDVEKMKSKYGLQSSADAPPDRLNPVARSTTSPILESSIKSSLNTIMPGLERPVGVHPLPNNTEIISTGTWVVHGASKLANLIDDLRDWNNGLHCFQPRTQQESLGLALTTAVLDGQDADHLQDIIEAVGDAGPNVLSQTASLRHFSLRQEQYLLTPLGNVTDRSLLLRRNQLDFPDGGPLDSTSNAASAAVEDMVFGTYRPSAERSTDQMEVLVEWKRIPEELKPEHRFICQMRIQKLARLLHVSTKRPPGFRVLPALGLLLGDNGSYGIVFKTPEPAGSRHLKLHHVLAGSKSPAAIPFEPTLLSRIELAIQLSTSFIQLHTSSWLHKRFSARNVLFFTRSDDSGARILPEDALSSPYITTFGFSRPVEDGDDSLSLDAFSLGQSVDANGILSLGDALYAHPASIGSERVAFSRAFDLYALGFVLLEIGLWTSLDALMPSATRLERLRRDAGPSHDVLQVIHDYIIDRYLGKLRVSIGGIFEDVTRWCLRSQFEDRSVDYENISLEFYWKVLWPLQQCKV